MVSIGSDGGLVGPNPEGGPVVDRGVLVGGCRVDVAFRGVESWFLSFEGRIVSIQKILA